MDTVLKMIAAALITAVLCLLISKKDKDISMLLSLYACCMIIILAFTYLEPVVDFLQQLQKIVKLDADIMPILLKSVGIGLLTEIAALMCTDLGNSALGRTLQIMAIAVILYLSLPLFTSLIELVSEILGEA